LPALSTERGLLPVPQTYRAALPWMQESTCAAAPLPISQSWMRGSLMKKQLALAAAAMTLATGLVGLTTTSASAYASCGRAAPPDIDHSAYVTANTNSNIRTGSNKSCTAVGVLSAGQRADYYCWTWNSDSTITWTYLRDVATGKQGWVRDDSLPWVNGIQGSGVHCGF
jgi:hypothetical protein